MRLYLDDIRIPNSVGWDIVRSSDEAKLWVALNGCPSYISFDHDLGGDDTAMVFIHWLIDEDIDKGIIPDDFRYNVHSANPVGAENIKGLISSYLKFKNRDGDKL